VESGILGFAGTQNFGAYTVPTGKAIRFESDPGRASASRPTRARPSSRGITRAPSSSVASRGGSDGNLLLGRTIRPT
jgi:hypothetical protein